MIALGVIFVRSYGMTHLNEEFLEISLVSRSSFTFITVLSRSIQRLIVVRLKRNISSSLSREKYQSSVMNETKNMKQN